MKYPFILAAVLWLAGITLSGCSEKIPPGNSDPSSGPAISVSVIPVRAATFPIFYDAVGSVKAQVSATLSSKLMGTVTEVKVKEGDVVKKGDTMVVMDARQVTAQLDQTRASLNEAIKAEAAAVSSLKAAEALAEQAMLAYNRGKKMLEGEAITRQDFEGIEAKHKQAVASLAQSRSMVEASAFRVKQARAAVDNAAVSRKDARVDAPFAGKVTAKRVDAGDLASPGMPLVTLEGIGAYRIDLVVPENYIRTIQPEQTVEVRIPAVGETPVQGSVLVIVPAADQASRTFIVQVLIPQDERIRSGMFARVTLPIGSKKTIRIPQSAVVRQGQLTGVYIVDERQTARFRLIRTGDSHGDQIEVISGISDETMIVGSPPSKLKNGSKVEQST